MFKRLLKLPLEGTYSIFLFGPRGTGKTSWLKENVPDAFYIDLLDYSFYGQLSSAPNRLDQMIPSGFQGWIIIDEVQRIPELLNEVHRLIEGKKYRFILTGSSARSLRKRGVNLLAGRALTYTMHPLTIQEIGKDFNFKDALHYGLLPSAVTRKNPRKYLKNYVQTYVREEVAQEGLTRNIGNFNKFLEVASFSQGQVLNISHIARELIINRQVVDSYFSILGDLLLAIRLPPFTKRAKRKMIIHEKFYYFDVGVYQNLRPTGPFDTREEMDGAGLETLFLESLRAINDYFELEYDIYFWRTSSGAEVDFVLYGPRGIHAFEIKRSERVTTDALKGLRLFQEDYPEARLHLLYGGNIYEYHDKITVHPFVEALKKLPELLS